eukprot:1583884-Pyramimonas_sp.AAC.1
MAAWRAALATAPGAGATPAAAGPGGAKPPGAGAPGASAAAAGAGAPPAAPPGSWMPRCPAMAGLAARNWAKMCCSASPMAAALATGGVGTGSPAPPSGRTMAAHSLDLVAAVSLAAAS